MPGLRPVHVLQSSGQIETETPWQGGRVGTDSTYWLVAGERRLEEIRRMHLLIPSFILLPIKARNDLQY